MKHHANLRHWSRFAASLLAAMSCAHAATYTWTQTGTGDQSWTTGTNWSGGSQFVSDAGNELVFFAGISGTANQLAAGASQVLINVPTSLEMNRLTLNGIGPNSDLGSSISIGTSASTWTIGDGTTSTVSLNSALGGGGANRDLRYTIGVNLTLVGNASGITTFTGNSTSGYGANFSGNITGDGKGVIKSGSSLLIFSGNNSYTGTTSVTAGVLRLSSADALSGGIGFTGGTSALTINGGVLELGATNFSRGLGTGSSQFQITGGTSGFSAHGGPRVVTVNGDASQELQWGSTHFAPTTLVLNQAYGFNTNVAPYANGSIELANKIDLNGATRTVQVGANTALLSNDMRNSTGTAGLTKTGAGTLVLTGNNTYNGTTTISTGTLSIDSVNNMGGSGTSNLAMNGGTLQIRGATLTSLSDLDSTVTFSNTAKGFDIQNASNIFTVDQLLTGTGTSSTLTKSGVGTLVLNQNNTYAGATTLSGGGTLLLDYSDSINGNGSKLSDTAALTLNGSAVVLKGGSHTEVVSATTLTLFTGNSISRDGGSAKISLGALTLTNNPSSLSISEANLATTTTANQASGILLLGRVTAGSDFGANDGSGNIVAYTGYTTYTPATATAGSTSVVNRLTGGGTLASSLSSYSLRIANSGNSDVLELNGKNLVVTNNGTFLYAGGGDNRYTINGTGSLTSTSGNQNFVINTYDGTTLTVNAKTSGNFAPVLKTGKGTLVLGGDNSTVGILYVGDGVVRVTNSAGLGNTTNGTNVQGGAALELANNIAIGAETLSLNGAGISNGGAMRNLSGANSWAGAITIGASGARINSDAGSLTLTGGIVTTLTQDLTIGGAGNTTVSTSAITGSGKVIKDGSGTLILSAANTYTGNTTVSAGTLRIHGSTSASSNFTVESGAVLGGRGTIGGTVTLNSGATLAPGASIESLETGSNIWSGGSNYQFEFSTDGSTGTAGAQWDLLAITGSLDLTGATVESPITFQLVSMLNATDAGPLASWNPDANATWAGIITTTAGITGFSANKFTFDTDGFQNPLNGSFSLVQSGTNLDLTYTTNYVIPEPKAALLGGLGILLLFRRRR
ncbi:MAG: hypothetical protein RL346_933 [Verrucomicrobiota bacterium]